MCLDVFRICHKSKISTEVLFTDEQKSMVVSQIYKNQTCRRKKIMSCRIKLDKLLDMFVQVWLFSFFINQSLEKIICIIRYFFFHSSRWLELNEIINQFQHIAVNVKQKSENLLCRRNNNNNRLLYDKYGLKSKVLNKFNEANTRQIIGLISQGSRFDSRNGNFFALLGIFNSYENLTN